MNNMNIVARIFTSVVVFVVTTSVAWSNASEISVAIEKVNQELESALAAGDAKRAAAIYTTDSQLLPPNSPMVSGKEDIIAFWQGGFDQGIGSADLETLELEIVSEDKAFEVGSFVIKNKQGVEINSGKYLIVWKKEKGAWKYHRDIWNSSISLAESQFNKCFNDE